MHVQMCLLPTLLYGPHIYSLMKKQRCSKQWGACFTGLVELNPGGSAAVNQRAELSSLQSSLNPTNHICYCCTGWNKSKWVDMGLCFSWRCGAVHFKPLSVFTCGCFLWASVCFKRQIWHQLAISAHFSLQLSKQPSFLFPLLLLRLYFISSGPHSCAFVLHLLKHLHLIFEPFKDWLCFESPFQHKRYQSRTTKTEPVTKTVKMF